MKKVKELAAKCVVDELDAARDYIATAKEVDDLELKYTIIDTAIRCLNEACYYLRILSN